MRRRRRPSASSRRGKSGKKRWLSNRPPPTPRPTSAAVPSWQRLLVAQLERHKRYPPQAGGKVGEARLAFSIDRGGRVLASRIVHSSGSDALDREALALLRRAAPLPPPP